MKNLLYLLGFVFVFVSCNTEIPEDQFRSQFGTQCMNKHAPKMLGEDATEDEKTEFCDCFTNSIIADSEVITMKSMFNVMKDKEKFQAAIEACKAEAMDEDEMMEETDSTQIDVDSPAMETEED